MGSTLRARWMNRLFGYDFFISYSWNDGRDYSVALASELERHGFEVFLDSNGFPAGGDWHALGDWSVRRSTQLILIGTADALTPGARKTPKAVETPIEREVRVFSTTKRPIIPIAFAPNTPEEALAKDRSTFALAEPDSLVAKRFSETTIRLYEADTQRPIGPSRATVDGIVNAFDHVRQQRIRFRAVFGVAVGLALSVLAISLLSANQGRVIDRLVESTNEAMTQSIIELEEGRPEDGRAEQRVDDADRFLNIASSLVFSPNRIDDLVTRSRMMRARLLRQKGQTERARCLALEAVCGGRYVPQAYSAECKELRKHCSAEPVASTSSDDEAPGEDVRICNPDKKWVSSEALHQLGIALQDQGRHEQARTAFSTALEIRSAAATREVDRVCLARGESVILNVLGRAEAESNDEKVQKDAEQRFSKAVEIADRLLSNEGSLRLDHAAIYRRGKSISLNELGEHQSRAGSLKAATEYHLRALGVLEGIAQGIRDHPEYKRSLAMTHDALGLVYERLGSKHALEGSAEAEAHYGKAIAQHERSLELRQALNDELPSVANAGPLAETLVFLGDAHYRLGLRELWGTAPPQEACKLSPAEYGANESWKRATVHYEKVAELSTLVMGATPTRKRYYLKRLTESHEKLRNLELCKGNWKDALSHARRALEAWTELACTSGRVSDIRELTRYFNMRGDTILALAKRAPDHAKDLLDDAESDYRHAAIVSECLMNEADCIGHDIPSSLPRELHCEEYQETQRTLVEPDDSLRRTYKHDVAISLDNLGKALQAQDRCADALAHYRRSVKLTRELLDGCKSERQSSSPCDGDEIRFYEEGLAEFQGDTASCALQLR